MTGRSRKRARDLGQGPFRRGEEPSSGRVPRAAKPSRSGEEEERRKAKKQVSSQLTGQSFEEDFDRTADFEANFEAKDDQDNISNVVKFSGNDVGNVWRQFRTAESSFLVGQVDDDFSHLERFNNVHKASNYHKDDVGRYSGAERGASKPISGRGAFLVGSGKFIGDFSEFSSTRRPDDEILILKKTQNVTRTTQNVRDDVGKVHNGSKKSGGAERGASKPISRRGSFPVGSARIFVN